MKYDKEHLAKREKEGVTILMERRKEQKNGNLASSLHL